MKRHPTFQHSHERYGFSARKKIMSQGRASWRAALEADGLGKSSILRRLRHFFGLDTIKDQFPSNNNFIYNQNCKVVFGFVPKAACTNWKSMFRYMNGADDYLDKGMAYDRVNSGLHYIDLDEQSNLLFSPHVKRYAMVRNPYSRTLSAYLNKVENRVLQPEEFPDNDFFLQLSAVIEDYRRSHFSQRDHPRVDFKVFLYWLRQSPPPYCYDNHWRRQTSLLRLPDIEYDYIGRFENLDKDAETILSAMGCQAPFPSQSDLDFPPTNAKSRLSHYYTDELVEIVNELYADDFKALGYDVAAKADALTG